jgi:hypothetical protein
VFEGEAPSWDRSLNVGRRVLSRAGVPVIAIAAVLALAGLAAPAAGQQIGTVPGAVSVGKPRVLDASCDTAEGYGCFSKRRVQPGGQVVLEGENFAAGAQVRFLGRRRDASDDVTAPADVISVGRLRATVPAATSSGRLVVINPGGLASAASRPIRIKRLRRRQARSGKPIVQAVATQPRYFTPGASRAAGLGYQIQAGSARIASVRIELVRLADRSIVRAWDHPSVSSGQPHVVTWDGLDGAGMPLSPAVYAFRLTATNPDSSLRTRRWSARRAARKRSLESFLRARSVAGRVQAAPVRVAKGTILLKPAATAVFPVLGAHQLDGYGAGGRFGADRGGRSHQGQDVPSPCGTPLVSIEQSEVMWKSFQGAAGHYVVLSANRRENDYAYMHLQGPALVEPGQQVGTGQLIGYVGDSGNARDCHLHFELWQGPAGWYRGAQPVDPFQFLASLVAGD